MQMQQYCLALVKQAVLLVVFFITTPPLIAATNNTVEQGELNDEDTPIIEEVLVTPREEDDWSLLDELGISNKKTETYWPGNWLDNLGETKSEVQPPFKPDQAPVTQQD